MPPSEHADTASQQSERRSAIPMGPEDHAEQHDVTEFAATKNLEIRILNGHHQGASCPVKTGARIGTDASCDIILRDASIPAPATHLHLAEEGWGLLSSDVPALDTETPWAFNTAANLGETLITVCAQEDPWRDIADYPVVENTPEPALPDSDERLLEDPVLSQPELAPSPLKATPKPRKRRPRATWIALSFALLIGGGVTAAVLSPFSFRSTSPTPSTLAALQQVQRTVSAFGLKAQTQVSLSPNGQITVTGWVPDTLVQNNLSTALAKIWPAPTMKVNNAQSVATTVKATLQDLNMALLLDYPNPRTLKVKGIAASDEDRAIALQRLANIRDTIPIKAVEILSADEVRSAFTRATQAIHLPPVTPKWKAGIMKIQGRSLSPLQHQNLVALVALLNKRYLNVFSLTQDATLTTSTLPFRIYSAVGGPQPWVMLENGTKLMVGGTYEDYRLKSIEDGRIVFEKQHTGQNATIIMR